MKIQLIQKGVMPINPSQMQQIREKMLEKEEK